jgi:putative DNA primase/helicase
MKTADAARGKWRGILLSFGVDSRFLQNKHGPCPFCEGTDRYRWDNKDGSGSFICSQCGAGTGFDFLKKLKGWDFKTCAQEVDKIVKNVQIEKQPKRIDDHTRKRLLNQLWTNSKRVTENDPVARYLLTRGVQLPQNLACIRYCASCPIPGSSKETSAMLSMITDAHGKPVNIHRTYLGGGDIGKATMPGEIPTGSAIRLATHGERLGIAEGIETALAATTRFGIPTWAAVSSSLLAKWTPPETVTEVVIFGDNDPMFGGAAAAYALAHRLAVTNRIKVEVKIPDLVGMDWADVGAAL